MRSLSATEAARNLSDVLDAIEHRGDSFVITRGKRPIATLGPVSSRNGAATRTVLKKRPTGGGLARAIQETRALLTNDVR